MRYLLILLLALLAAACPAQPLRTVHELRVQADQAMTGEKYPEAYAALRDAALLAQHYGETEAQVQCMLELAALGLWRGSPEPTEADAQRLLKRAVALAAQAGNPGLEYEALVAAWTADETAWALEVMDAAAAAGQWEMLEAAMPLLLPPEEEEEEAEPAPGEDAVAAALPPCLEALDLLAEATLARDGAKFRAAAAVAAKAGLVRLQVHILSRGVAVDAALAPELALVAAKRGDRRAMALAALTAAPANPPAEGKDKALNELQQALAHARACHDAGLEAALCRRLGAWTGGRHWQVAAEAAERRGLERALEAGRLALAHPFLRTEAVTAGLRACGNHAEAVSLLRALGQGESAPVSAENAKAYCEALKAALLDEKTGVHAAIVAEITGRPEAMPVLLEAVQGEKFPWPVTYAIETLAQPSHRAALIALLEHKDATMRECAAAALFRVGLGEFAPAARDILPKVKSDIAGVYLKGALVRAGDLALLEELKATAAGSGTVFAISANGVLASLGYASPMRALNGLPDNVRSNSHMMGDVLARMPRNWGAELVYYTAGEFNYAGARAAALRGDTNRRSAFPVNQVGPLLWLAPRRNEVLDGDCNDVRLWYENAKNRDPVVREMLGWICGLGGMRGGELESTLAPAENESTLRRLLRTELATAPEPLADNQRRIVLIDVDDIGYGRCLATAELGLPELADNRLLLPLRFEVSIEGVGTGIVGQMYTQVILALAATDVLKKVSVEIPGLPPLTATGSASDKDFSTWVVELPTEAGEGLEVRKLPLDRILQGTIKLELDFNGNPGSLSFPLTALPVPAGDKPDLVPEALVVEPPVPERDQPARVLVRVRNKGCTLDRRVASVVRIEAMNPQNERGWRGVASIVFENSIWRAGEVRTFELRPRFVDGYYMNRYSYHYTPALGDSRLRAVVDPSNFVAELSEDNNTLEMELPLEKPEAEGKRLAEAEVLQALQKPLEDVQAADTVDKLDEAWRRCREVLDPLLGWSDATAVLTDHYQAAYCMKRARLRSQEAVQRVQKAKAEGKLTHEVLRAAQQEIASAEAAYVAAGAPIKVEALEKARNATLLAANLPDAHNDLRNLLDEEQPFSEATKVLKVLDGAMLLAIEAQRARRDGSVDSGNVLDAAANFADAVELKVPGFSNLHRALLKAELDYADKGMRKNATALDAISSLIAQEAGAQERLDAAVADVGQHITAGPFNREAMTDIVKGWVKDLPVVGKLADVLFSWK
ncbi:MAG: hypothetical protein IT463_08850 [Planctomycetes bacterium]|nr:hypothetical protein [Planctomycetota bacterium]